MGLTWHKLQARNCPPAAKCRKFEARCHVYQGFPPEPCEGVSHQGFSFSPRNLEKFEPVAETCGIIISLSSPAGAPTEMVVCGGHVCPKGLRGFLRPEVRRPPIWCSRARRDIVGDRLNETGMRFADARRPEEIRNPEPFPYANNPH